MSLQHLLANEYLVEEQLLRIMCARISPFKTYPDVDIHVERMQHFFKLTFHKDYVRHKQQGFAGFTESIRLFNQIANLHQSTPDLRYF